MADIGTDIAQTTPAVGTAGPTYASTINAIIDEVILRLEAKVKVSSIDAANADLDMNANAVTNAEYVGLYPAQSTPSGSPFGRIVYYNDEFYLVTNAGVIQLTSTGAINLSSVGSITGDFGTGPEAVTFVNASERYDFWDDQAGGGYAIVRAKQFDFIDEASANVVRFKPSASISASYDLTLPTSLPASTELLAVTAAGVMQKASTAAVTQYSVNALDIKHTGRTEWSPPSAFDWVSTSGAPARNTTNGKISGGAAVYGVRIFLPPPPVGKRITSVSARVQQAGSGTNTCTIQWFTITDGTVTSVASNTTTTTGAPVTVTASANSTVASNVIYCVDVSFTTTGVATLYEIFAIGLAHDYV